MLKDIEACIFDMDGTLVDSMWVWGRIDIEYLGKFGFDVPKNMGKEIEGLSMREVAEYFKTRFGIKDDIDSIIEEWNDMALYEYTHKVPLKPHVKEFIEYIKSKNIKVGVFTSNSKVLAKAAFEALGLMDYIDVITAGCSGIKGKPAPDGYLLTAKSLSVSPNKCLVFEDLMAGIQAGINAGMKVCAVSDEYSKNQEIQKREKAHYFIEDYNEIIKK